MTAKVIGTGKILKNVRAFEKNGFGMAVTFIDEDDNTVYKADDLMIGCDEPLDHLLTEQEAYRDYQERSNTSGERANQLAWAFIIILCAQLVGGSKYAEPYIMAAGGICYMLLSGVQSLWQAVSIWIVKQRIQKGIAFSDYPVWVGGIAWLFYYTKMIVIIATAIYSVSHFIKLL